MEKGFHISGVRGRSPTFDVPFARRFPWRVSVQGCLRGNPWTLDTPGGPAFPAAPQTRQKGALAPALLGQRWQKEHDGSCTSWHADEGQSVTGSQAGDLRYTLTGPENTKR
ncbi:uncharacterized protein LOC144336392 isoform X2 [Macaca mulatta]